MLKVRLMKSPIGCTPVQRKTLQALGLTRIRKSKEFKDTPTVQGMLARVHHLIEVEK